MDFQLLKKYYGGISILPCFPRKKDRLHKQWNYKRYSINDINPNHNIAIHTGSEVFKDTFSCVFDLDYDTKKFWHILKEPVTHIFGDTVIVKSGGNHNGLHVHYLTPTPVSSISVATKYGMIELKAIGEDGSPDAIMLPPSKVLKQYRVIHPYNGIYIDFNQVKLISTTKLENKFQDFINQMNK